MASNVIPAIPAAQLVDVVPSALAAGGSPLQFWGMLVDANLGVNGYPLLPMGEVILFANATDASNYFGATSQEAGLADVYFQAPVNATRQPSGLLMTQYALNAVPSYLRGGNVSGLSLGQLQAVNASLTVSIDGTPITQTVNLSAATSFSNAAEIIGQTLAIKGVQKGTIQGTLVTSTPTLTVTSLTEGLQQAEVTATFAGTNMTVTSVQGGYLAVGQVITGTGVTPPTTITAYNGGGVPGGVGSYTLSASPTPASGIAVTAFAPTPVIALGDVITGTDIPANTYISAFGTGTGGVGTYTMSNNASGTVASPEAIAQFAPGVSWSPLHGSFDVHSGTTGTSTSVSFGSGAAAATLGLTQAAGAVQSVGAAASSPTAFMNSITAQTQNFVSFMTSWEPTDSDKATNAASSFAAWNNAQGNGFRYVMWETNVLDTEFGSGPSAAVAAINNADYSGTVMIYTNPAITTLAGEKAAFSMGWAASLDFNRQNGRQTEAFKSYVGGIPDVTNGTVAETIAGAPQTGSFGFGMNFYGFYTTRSQGFPEFQRGTISGPFVWDDTYTDQIWLNNNLQNAIMIGLAASNSVPYANPGYAQIESWCLDPILQAVNFGAIVAGVELSQAQAQEVNTAAGLQIDQVLTQRGWYLQVQPASAAIRAVRTSPVTTLWWCDGGSIQAVTLASITVQ